MYSTEKEKLEQRAAVLRDQAERLLVRADEIESRPNEPEPLEDGTCVVQILKQFRSGSQTYVYAASLSSDGLWYLTGKWVTGLTWLGLLDRIYDGSASVEIWLATEYTELT